MGEGGAQRIRDGEGRQRKNARRVWGGGKMGRVWGGGGKKSLEAKEIKDEVERQIRITMNGRRECFGESDCKQNNALIYN